MGPFDPLNLTGDGRTSGVHSPEWLQRAWILQLRRHYDIFNWEYLGSQLRPPILRIGAAGGRLGEWDPRNRTITLSEQHILAHPWETVLDTLRHEMAHQYVDEVLGLSHAPPHGEPFARACRLLRCDARPAAAREDMGRIEHSPAERDKILSRVKDLLALAGSPNEHEAANAMRLAHKYLLKYNLDLAQLDADSSYEFRHLGKSSPRIQEYEYTLSNILQSHFFVLVLWISSFDARRNKAGRVLQIAGTPENLEMAEYVYDYVMRLGESLWEERKRSARRERVPGRPGAGPRGTKFQYLAGLFRGFEDKLAAGQQNLEEEHGLVWLGDPELKGYFDYLHPRTSSISYTGVSRSDQYRAGVEDGRDIHIRRGISQSRGNRGRMLPGPGS